MQPRGEARTDAPERGGCIRRGLRPCGSLGSNAPVQTPGKALTRSTWSL